MSPRKAVISQTNYEQPPSLKSLPLPPYAGDDTPSNTLICPHYAESDCSTAAPSPSTIESFDVLDSIPWRRSYISLDAKTGRPRFSEALRVRWRENKRRIIIIVLLFTVLVAGSFAAGSLAVERSRGHTREACRKRGDGSLCEDVRWAKCVSTNGLGFCEGAM